MCQPNSQGCSMPMMPLAPPVICEIARGDADDLAEAERDDGEIVGAQPQRRRRR